MHASEATLATHPAAAGIVFVQEWGHGSMPLNSLFIDDNNINPECHDDWVPSGEGTSCPFSSGVIYGQHLGLGYSYSEPGYSYSEPAFSHNGRELRSWNVTVSCEIQSMEFHPDMMHSRMLLEVSDNLSPGALKAADMYLQDLAVFSGVPAGGVGLLSAVEENGSLDSGGMLIGTITLELPPSDEEIVWDLTMALNMNPREALPSLGGAGYYLQFVSAVYYPLYTMDNADSVQDNSSPPSAAPISIIITGAAIAGAVSSVMCIAGLVCVICARRRHQVLPLQQPRFCARLNQIRLYSANYSATSDPVIMLM